MATFLDRIDSAPVLDNDFNFEFNLWLSVLVDTLNEIVADIEASLNLFSAPSYTSVQIAAMAADLPDGIFLYDTDLDVYVGRQAGALVQFTTAAYP